MLQTSTTLTSLDICNLNEIQCFITFCFWDPLFFLIPLCVFLRVPTATTAILTHLHRPWKCGCNPVFLDPRITDPTGSWIQHLWVQQPSSLCERFMLVHSGPRFLTLQHLPCWKFMLWLCILTSHLLFLSLTNGLLVLLPDIMLWFLAFPNISLDLWYNYW